MLYKARLKNGFAVEAVEKHFHDQDETWIVLKGTGTSYSIDHEGNREEFALEEGDAWLVPAGFEHGLVEGSARDLELTVVFGTRTEGSHEIGHYYVEQEGYIPSLRLVKTPTDRYHSAGTK